MVPGQAGSMQYRSSHILVALPVLFIALPLLALAQEPPPTEQQPSEDQPPKPRLDLYGDPLPEGAIARLGSRRFQHLGPISCARYSPDGKTIISSGFDGMVRIWEARTGKEIRSLEIKAWLPSISISENGSRIVTGGYSLRGFGKENAIRIWDAATGEVVKKLSVGQGGAFSVALSPNSSTLFAAVMEILGGSAAVWVLDIESGEQIRKLDMGPKPGLVGLTLSPDGKTLVTTHWESPPTIWAAATGKEVRKLKIREGGVGIYTVAFSPDGKTLATADLEGAVDLWDPNTGKLRRQIAGRDKMIIALAYSPDGKILAMAAADQSLQLWDTEKGEEIRELQRRPANEGRPVMSAGMVQPLAFSPDSRNIVTSHRDYALHLWDVSTGKEVSAHEGHTAPIPSLGFSPDGKILATVSRDGTVRLWDVATRKERTVLRHHSAPVSSVAFSPGGRTVATVSTENVVRLSDFDTGEQIESWKLNHPEQDKGQGIASPWNFKFVKSLSFSPDGSKVIAITSHSAVIILDLEKEKQRVVSKGASNAIRMDRIFRLGADPELLMLTVSRGVVSAWGETASSSVDGRILAFRSGRAEVKVCDGATGQERLTVEFESGGVQDPFDAHGNRISALAVSPAGGILVTGHADGQIRVSEIATGGEIISWKASEHLVNAVALCPEGNLVASGAVDGGVSIWDLSNGVSIAKRKGHDWGVLSVAFSPDGKILASGGLDGSAVLWDASSFAWDDWHWANKLWLQDLADLWKALAAKDAADAYDAIWMLASFPETTIPFLKKRIQPAHDADPKEVRRLITDLDNDEFSRREKAVEALSQIGQGAERILLETVKGGCRPEVRLRVTKLLQAFQPPFPGTPSDTLRGLRVIRILERIGPEGKEILESLATGSPHALQTREAKSALERLEARKEK